MRALLVAKGEYFRHVARVAVASSMSSGGTFGKHFESPCATNCGMGFGSGRAYGTERTSKLDRFQRRRSGKPMRKSDSQMKNLQLRNLGEAYMALE
jgi:hypothetical protein